MNRLFIALFVLNLCVAVTTSADAEQAQPNIIVFLVDDMGVMDTSVPFLTGANEQPQVHPLNKWYRTPNMEKLASRGVRFSNFYAHTVCSPTRVSIMTGQNSARHWTTNFISPNGKNTGRNGADRWKWEGLTAADVTLPSLLQRAGYRTIHVGKAHFGPVGKEGENPLKLGFDVNIAGCAYGQPGSYYGEDGYGNLNPKRKGRAVPGLEKYHKTDTFLTEALTIEAKAAIDSAVEADKPFYLYMSHYAVHGPFNPDKRFMPNYENSNRPKSSQAFAALIEGMDKSLGDLMTHLDEKKLSEETIIFFLGDNGSASPFGKNGNIASSAPLRGKKGSQWEGGIRVPFIAAWAKPDLKHPTQMQLPIKANSVQSQIGACFDLFPTIAQIASARVPRPHKVDGQNLRSLLTGERDDSLREVFLSHFPHPRSDNHFTTYRKENWKLIYHYFPGKSVPRYALYDLGKDPSESNDVAAQNPDIVKQLATAMATELTEMKALYPVADGAPVKPIVP